MLNLGFVRSCLPKHAHKSLLHPSSVAAMLNSSCAVGGLCGRRLQFVHSTPSFSCASVGVGEPKKTKISKRFSGRLTGNLLVKQDVKLYVSKLRTKASRPSLKSIQEISKKNWLLSLSTDSDGDHSPMPTSGEGDNEEEDFDLEMMAMEDSIPSTNGVPDPKVSELVIGVDPDVSGAIAILKVIDETVTAQVLDVPTVKVIIGNKMRRRHDTRSIVNLVNGLRAPKGSIAFVEQSLPFPKDGKQGWWCTGFGYGVWLGALVASGFSVVPIRSQVWKGAMGILGTEHPKDESRLRAATLFPDLSPQLQRKKDHGRAEALLIAAFGKGYGAGCA